MMNMGSPKLLVIAAMEQREEEEDEEINFQPHVTPREKLLHTVHIFIGCLFALLRLLRGCLRRSRWSRVASSGAAANEVGGAEEEGWGKAQSSGSLDHNTVRPEVTSEALQMEMEAATPLPGVNVTTPPPGEPAGLVSMATEQQVDPSSPSPPIM